MGKTSPKTRQIHTNALPLLSLYPFSEALLTGKKKLEIGTETIHINAQNVDSGQRTYIAVQIDLLPRRREEIRQKQRDKAPKPSPPPPAPEAP